MYKTNPYNGKKYKKKKVYSPIKDPYIVSDELITKGQTDGINIFMELFHIKDNPWMIFFRDVLKGNNTSPWNPLERLEYIIYLTPNESLQKKIYSELMDIKDYDPLNDPLPMEQLSDSVRKYIEKVQQKIKTNIFTNMANEIILTKNGVPFKCTASKDFNFFKINFKSGYDIVIYLDNNLIKVCSSLHSIKGEDAYKIYLNDIGKKLKTIYTSTNIPDKNIIEIDLLKEEASYVEIIENIISLLETDLKIIKKDLH